MNHNSRELAKTHMEVVSLGRVDGQTAVSEDLQDFVEVCEDVAASESVLDDGLPIMSIQAKSNGENVVFAFESEERNIAGIHFCL